jgi:rhamnulokinase/L-fuculokinase
MPGTVVGQITPDICEELTVEPVDVVAVGSHDTASAAISVPTDEKDFVYISCGTWSLFGTELKEPHIGEDSLEYSYTNEGGYNNTIRFLTNIMGTWLIQESRRQWKREGNEYSFAQMEAWAKEAKPFASLINPDYHAFNTPGNMPEKIREFCRITGQHVPETVGEVVRCIYESLALKYRFTVETLESLRNKKTAMINVVGGGTKDKFLSQMTADACGIPVCAGPEEATAMGNIVMQAIAAGEIANLSEAREVVANSTELKYYEPTKQRDAWDCAFERFCKLATIV